MHFVTSTEKLSFVSSVHQNWRPCDVARKKTPSFDWIYQSVNARSILLGTTLLAVHEPHMSVLTFLFPVPRHIGMTDILQKQYLCLGFFSGCPIAWRFSLHWPHSVIFLEFLICSHLWQSSSEAIRLRSWFSSCAKWLGKMILIACCLVSNSPYAVWGIFFKIVRLKMLKFAICLFVLQMHLPILLVHVVWCQARTDIHWNTLALAATKSYLKVKTGISPSAKRAIWAG